MTAHAKDLTKEAPASAHDRVGGYVILARLTDKCRAMIGGDLGEYHTDCPLDNFLLGFKGIPYAEVRAEIENDATDEDIADYLDSHGTPKTPEEVEQWSDSMDAFSFSNIPEKKEWFAGECAKLGIDPAKTSLFEWLDAEDDADFKK